MKTFSVHVRDSALSPKIVLVGEGFSWPAALFGMLWALALGLWEVAALLLLANLGLLALLAGSPQPVSQVAMLGMSLITGLAFGELQRWNLARRGAVETATVRGPTRLAAEARYLGANPFLLARLAGAP